MYLRKSSWAFTPGDGKNYQHVILKLSSLIFYSFGLSPTNPSIMSNKLSQPIYESWKFAFLEIAVRAIRKVHLEHGMWGIGQHNKSPEVFSKMNLGHGIELAHETSVCAQITQDFINSRFTNGNVYNDQQRFYEIDREVKIYKDDKTEKQVDIFINRFVVDKNKPIFYRYPTLIEAKRIHYYIPDPVQGEAILENNIDERIKIVKKDIDKLLKVRKRLKKKLGFETRSDKEYQKYAGQIKDAFIYTLCWGYYDKQTGKPKSKTTPQYFIKQLEKKYGKLDVQIRWLPLKWEPSNNSKIIEPTVTRFMWIALVEIKKIALNPNLDFPITNERWIIDRI